MVDFDHLVEQTQNEPVEIAKNGQPVTVTYSDYAFKRFIDIGISAADQGRVRPLTQSVMAEIKAKAKQLV